MSFILPITSEQDMKIIVIWITRAVFDAASVYIINGSSFTEEDI